MNLVRLGGVADRARRSGRFMLVMFLRDRRETRVAVAASGGNR